MRTPGGARVAGYALPIAILAAIVALPASTWIRNMARDDALYYPTVARNIASGLGSTYDGITPTNGYHPLWCWLQVPVAVATGSTDPMTYLWWVKALMVAVVAAAVVVWARLIGEVTGSTWAAATFALLIGGYWWSVHTLNSGMETPLVILLMGISLLLARRLLDSFSAKVAVALGFAMAATFLARLDSVFFLATLSCALLVVLWRYPRVTAAWLAPMLLTPIPYLWWNATMFGHVIPVSGIRKSVQPNIGDQVAILARFVEEKLAKAAEILHPIGAASAALLLAMALVATWFARRELRYFTGKLGLLWALPVGAALHFVYVAVFMVEVDVSWYQYAEYLTIFLAASTAIAAIAARIQTRQTGRTLEWTPFALALVAVLASLGIVAPRAMPDVANVRAYDAAVWARDHWSAANRPRFGMYDPGVFQYVSGLTTLALNGLASTREVVTLVQDRRWSEIIRRYDVDYVVQFVPDVDIATIPASFIVYRSEPFEKFAWRHSRTTTGSLLILDAGYPQIDTLI